MTDWWKGILRKEMVYPEIRTWVESFENVERLEKTYLRQPCGKSVPFYLSCTLN